MLPALGDGGEEYVKGSVLTNEVGGRLILVGEVDRGVVACIAEGGGDEAEEITLARSCRAVALDEEVVVSEIGVDAQWTRLYTCAEAKCKREWSERRQRSVAASGDATAAVYGDAAAAVQMLD